jgi:hypothetical protein
MADSTISSTAPISTLLRAQTITPVSQTATRGNRTVIENPSNARSSTSQGGKPGSGTNLPRGSLVDILA